jgi:hypothetical protein
VVALLAALAALLTLFDLTRQISSGGAALLATALVASSLPFWAAATMARFYAPFLLFYLLTLRALTKHPGTQHPVTPAPWHLGTPAPWHLSTLAVLARLSHELAFTLAAIPLVALIADRRGTRRRWVVATAAVTLGLVIAQAFLFGLHHLVEQGGTSTAGAPAAAAPVSMVDRFFVWQVVNLVEWPLDPFDFFRHIAWTMPLMTTGVIVALVMRAAGVGRPWSGAERFAHLLWIGWVIFFGIIDSGITINYLLLPVVLMLVTFAIDIGALTRGRWLAPAAVLVAAVLALEQWAGLPSRQKLEAVRPTIETPAGVDIRALAANAPHVACTDELACLLLAGRVDSWLALDDFLRERFIILRDGRDVGVYAGSPVVSNLDDLFAPQGDAQAPERVLVVDVFKDLPVGRSSAFLDRALAASSLVATPIARTDHLRLLELRR